MGVEVGSIVDFVWRCPGCGAVYESESLLFLYADGDFWYCPCGERLVEEVEPVSEHHYRLVIPEHLQGTALHRQLERQAARGRCVEVESGQGGQGISLLEHPG